jgi:F-type H+-transporting ATPase subunit delta
VRDSTVSGRYARALFLLSEKRRETAAALEDLKGVRDLLMPGSSLASFLASPQVRLSEKRRMMGGALEGRATPSVAAFTDLLLRKKRLTLLPDITRVYEALVEQAQGIRRAHLVSAVALLEAERTRLHAALEAYTGSTVRLTAEVNPDVLGGALVRIGDRVVDRTVRTMLEAIGNHLHEARV